MTARLATGASVEVVTEPQGFVHGDVSDRATGFFDLLRHGPGQLRSAISLHKTESSTGRIGRLGPDVHDPNGQGNRNATAVQVAYDAINLLLRRVAQVRAGEHEYLDVGGRLLPRRIWIK